MRVDLGKFRYLHKGETAVIVGNGPSLRAKDLEALSRHKTFGSNMIYRFPFTPTYYSVVDKEMLDSCLPLPWGFRPTMFLRAEAMVEGNNPIYPIVAGGFSKNIDNFVVLGGTVTYVLFQLAYYMGFTTLLLLGVDHNYPAVGSLPPGQQFVAGKKDPDHFPCNDMRPYFRAGETYNAPELERAEQYYKLASAFFRENGIVVINLTQGSRLDMFEKGLVKDWM